MNILFLGAHTDDIELGCGALLLDALQKKHNVIYMSFSRCLDLERNRKIIYDQQDISDYLRSLGVKDVIMHDYPNKKLHSVANDIRQDMSLIQKQFNPSLIFTHWERDIHQDHEAVSKETLRVFNGKSIIYYDISKSCINFDPNFFFSMTENTLRNKLKLLGLYRTQKNLPYFNLEFLKSKARVYGASINSLYAEAFKIKTLSIGENVQCVPLL